MIGSKVMLAILLLSVTYADVKASPHNRIVNGGVAHMYQFPWHCSLHITPSDSTQLRYCGGSLITNQFVLTAAVCLRNNPLSARVDMGSVQFMTPMETQESTEFIVHSEYNSQNNLNNIGLIRLPRIVNYSNSIRAILIPGLRQLENLYIDEEVDIPGFGVSEIGSNFLSEMLRFANKKTITNEQCRQSFPASFVADSAICAIGINSTSQTACFGDIGGGLVIQYEYTWMLVGITSTLPDVGCTGSHPVVFTRLTSYSNWIHSMTGALIDF